MSIRMRSGCSNLAFSTPAFPSVEDQEDLRGVLRSLLTGSGYEMLEAASPVATARTGTAPSGTTGMCTAKMLRRQKQE